MGLEFMDGFELYMTNGSTYGRWSVLSNANVGPTGGRRGGGCAVLSATGYMERSGLPNQATRCVGFAAYRTAAPPLDIDILRFSDGAANQVTLQLTPTCAIKAFRNGTSVLLGVSDTGVVRMAAWQYIEVQVTIDNAAGGVDVWVDGVNVLHLTGVDTQQSANAYSNAVRLVGGFTSVDDFYCLNTLGTTNNARKGDVRIDAHPVVADGTYADFTPSTGVDHYATVDEIPPSTADYNESGTVGHRDSFTIAEPTIPGTIHAAQVVTLGQNPGAGTRTMKNFVRSGGADYDDAAAMTLSNTWLADVSIQETDPGDAGAWTNAKLGAAEFGYKVEA